MGVPVTDGPSSAVDRSVEVERTWLDDRSWLDVARGFVTEADALYDHLVEAVDFQESRVYRYDHWQSEPRLGAWMTPATAPHPVLAEVQRTLQHRYSVRFDGAGLAWYRDGRDSIAMHRDRDLKWLDETVIALLVLGARRPFPMRPLAAKYRHEEVDEGIVDDLSPGHGDLLVMGGATQTGWQHGVPKVDARVGGRISVQWRWTSRQGRMERGGSYRKPRHFDR